MLFRSENSENLSPPTPSTSSTSQAIPKQSGRLLLGWNLRESSSKLEYRENHFNVGVYHSRTLSAITGQESFTEALAFQLNTQWDDEKMRASIQLPWNFPYYSFSVTKEFSADFSSSLTTQAAAQGSRLARKLELKVVLTF